MLISYYGPFSLDRSNLIIFSKMFRERASCCHQLRVLDRNMHLVSFIWVLPVYSTSSQSCGRLQNRCNFPVVILPEPGIQYRLFVGRLVSLFLLYSSEVGVGTRSQKIYDIWDCYRPISNHYASEYTCMVEVTLIETCAPRRLSSSKVCSGIGVMWFRILNGSFATVGFGSPDEIKVSGMAVQLVPPLTLGKTVHHLSQIQLGATG